MSICARCEKSFTCGLLEGDADVPCWCTRLPALPSDKLGQDSPTCYCPDCLRALVAGSSVQDRFAD